ncbi:LacI family DNA-binding transcriptional regulator [Parafrigoribacterium mesophilum]|uniref:LacI family DNA-binding transcriptional regulator n=1 Tax=Parafrigoribacterium mesophilum TaxID=433646 RepID=UPI0031FC15CA
MTTIRQVAAAAGVSVATASRALSGSPSVIEPTRQRVLDVAAELDFTVSRLARSLVTGSTGNVGVILPDVTNPFYSSFLAELESGLDVRDIGLLVGDSHEDPARELGIVRRMTSQVDALVLASSRLDDDSIIAAAARMPVVLANCALAPQTPLPEKLHQVVVDIDRGFTDAVRHLHSLGHTSLVYLDGPVRSWSGRHKRAVLDRACQSMGMRVTTVGTDTPDFAAGWQAASGIDTRVVTAVIAFNDEVALGALCALRESGIDVPRQVSVIGCDDSLPDGLAWPSLTTVDSSSRALGALAAAAILGTAPSRTAHVPTHLVVRHSTSVARHPSPKEPTP